MAQITAMSLVTLSFVYDKSPGPPTWRYYSYQQPYTRGFDKAHYST